MSINTNNIQFYANSEDISETVLNRPITQLIGEIESNFLDLAGGTLTGDLNVQGNITSNHKTVSQEVNGVFGLSAELGGTDYHFGYNSLNQTLSAGFTGNLKPVAVRERTPISDGFMIWDGSNSQLRSIDNSDAKTFLDLGEASTYDVNGTRTQPDYLLTRSVLNDDYVTTWTTQYNIGGNKTFTGQVVFDDLYASGENITNLNASSLNSGEVDRNRLPSTVQFDDDFGRNINSASGEGYQRISDGIILQFGTVFISGDSQATVNFPINFPNGCLQAVVTLASNFDATDDGATATFNLTSTSMTVKQGCATAKTVRWIAIGW